MKPIGRREFLKGTGVGLAALLAAPDLAFSKIRAVGDPLGIPLQGVGGSLPERVDLGPGPVRNSQRGVRGQMLLEGLLQGRNSAREEQTATYPIYARHTPGKYTWKCNGKDRGEYIRYGPGGSSLPIRPGAARKDHLLRLHEAGKLPQVPAQESGRARGRKWKKSPGRGL